MVETQPPYGRVLSDLRTGVGLAPGGADATVERAAAMLAGRVGCRIAQAHAHLARIAAEHQRDVREVADELLLVLESHAAPGGAGRARSVVAKAIHARPKPPVEHLDQSGDGGAAALVQQVLDAVPGAYVWLTPVCDTAGVPVDFIVQAVSPDSVDALNRRGAAMLGVSVREAYPSTVDGPVWRAYRAVLADGVPRHLDPLEFRYDVDGVVAHSTFAVRVHPLGAGLLVGWLRHEAGGQPHERIAQTERLASLGRGEWDLISGNVTWSDELYRIYERDPGLGPLPREEATAMILPEDQPVLATSADALQRGETVDMMYRIQVNGRIKHLRAVLDAVRDGHGQPTRLYGVVQDVTSREMARARLATVERQLREHQQTLAAEHRLAADLQQIILPIPEGPIDLPGLRVAIRYLPAERASRVGGDWYHAATVRDGRVLLAVGDVAGHGLHAATVMAQLRHALAALAVTTTSDPAELLSHLNTLLCATEASTATAVIARYDPADGSVVWAQAGHPAPLRTRAGATLSLPRPRGPLLGAVPHAVYQTATLRLGRRDLLLFYTDGLVEDRKRSLEEGLRPVIATLDEISARANPAPLAELLSRLRRANPDDDTCVLAARPHAHPPWSHD